MLEVKSNRAWREECEELRKENARLKELLQQAEEFTLEHAARIQNLMED